ncbi:hypothetical protein VTN00DRAFT_878 [Thermoascus crustaceus]|uniref:uncharacterized protein n=1 Tax=Thermoascus crustaceus TaxID=5088 RepID=UPI0037432764
MTTNDTAPIQDKIDKRPICKHNQTAPTCNQKGDKSARRQKTSERKYSRTLHMQHVDLKAPRWWTYTEVSRRQPTAKLKTYTVLGPKSKKGKRSPRTYSSIKTVDANSSLKQKINQSRDIHRSNRNTISKQNDVRRLRDRRETNRKPKVMITRSHKKLRP